MCGRYCGAGPRRGDGSGFPITSREELTKIRARAAFSSATDASRNTKFRDGMGFETVEVSAGVLEKTLRCLRCVSKSGQHLARCFGRSFESFKSIDRQHGEAHLLFNFPGEQ